jgi:chromosome segregation ATPase
MSLFNFPEKLSEFMNTLKRYLSIQDKVVKHIANTSDKVDRVEASQKLLLDRMENLEEPYHQIVAARLEANKYEIHMTDYYEELQRANEQIKAHEKTIGEIKAEKAEASAYIRFLKKTIRSIRGGKPITEYELQKQYEKDKEAREMKRHVMEKLKAKPSAIDDYVENLKKDRKS